MISARLQTWFEGIRSRVQRAILMVLHEVLGPPPEILDLTDAPGTASHDRHKEETEPCQDEDETKP